MTRDSAARAMEILLYDRELEVMHILWDEGPSTVSEVKAALEDEMAYNTVLTVLRRLADKGYVGHEEEGRAHRYHALIPREAAHESALERLTHKVFGGNRELLFTHLVSARKLTKVQLRRLRALVDDQLEEK